MKKIVGIIAAFALVAGTVFADPDLTPTITSFKGNAGLEYVANLDTEAVGFNNFSSAEFEVQFKSADWGGKSTSGDGLWGELTIRTGSEIKVKGPGNAWTVPGAEVTTAKLHFIDGDTYLHMDDYNENKGYCNDKEHNYYGDAKEALENLSPEDRAKLAYDGNYADAYSRLQSWASANGESLYIDPKSGYVFYDYEETSFDNTPLLVACISVIAVAAIGFTTFLIITSRKKKIL